MSTLGLNHWKQILQSTADAAQIDLGSGDLIPNTKLLQKLMRGLCNGLPSFVAETVVSVTKGLFEVPGNDLKLENRMGCNVELVEIWDELTGYYRRTVAAGAAWTPDASPEENGMRNYCMQHFILQNNHTQSAEKLARDWSQALVARAMLEASVTLRWAVLKRLERFKQLQALAHIYDYETLKKTDPKTLEQTAEQATLQTQIYRDYFDYAFSTKKKNALSRAPDPARDDFKGSHTVLGKIEDMFAETGVSYDRYRMLSDWTHGSPPGLSRLLDRQSDRWVIKEVSDGWLLRCFTAMCEALLETAIITAEFRDTPALPRFQELQRELGPFITAASI